MAEFRSSIRFLLNDTALELSDVSPTATLLDFIRLRARLTGTKEGCAEGDCGACTVLIGRLNPEGQLRYQTANACILFLASVDGCHIVTVEQLSAGGVLHPVQQSLVQHHGSQCGFCTPGIVMSLYALWMENDEPTKQDVDRALQGNLCRCTGYASIVKAAQNMERKGDFLSKGRADVEAKLSAWKDKTRVVMSGDHGDVVLPHNKSDLAEVLKEKPTATIVAGATDVGLWVTKLLKPISTAVHIGQLDDLKAISLDGETLTIGAGVSYSDFLSTIVEHLPALENLWWRIGGEQVRNMGTIGGNIANGSPIGDTPPILIALGAELTIFGEGNRRQFPLEDFFVSYGKQDLHPGEFVEAIKVCLPPKNSIVAAHKISKRPDEDISTICGAFNIMCHDGKVSSARIAYGGMAATPKRATRTEERLKGQRWSEEAIRDAQKSLDEDFSPISDMRASAEYRALVAKNILMKVYLENSDQEQDL